jgi:histidine triad (HIT) family protein
MEKRCLFCDIWEKRESIIYFDKFFYSQLDKFPISPGHAEVIPKRHSTSIFDLTIKEWNSLRFAVDSTIKIIEYTDLVGFYSSLLKNPINEKSKWLCQEMLKHPSLEKKPDAYNFGNNDGKAAGRTIDHFHFHIIPRYTGDMQDPTGGIRNIIPKYGNYKE